MPGCLPALDFRLINRKKAAINKHCNGDDDVDDDDDVLASMLPFDKFSERGLTTATTHRQRQRQKLANNDGDQHAVCAND